MHVRMYVRTYVYHGFTDGEGEQVCRADMRIGGGIGGCNGARQPPAPLPVDSAGPPPEYTN